MQKCEIQKHSNQGDTSNTSYFIAVITLCNQMRLSEFKREGLAIALLPLLSEFQDSGIGACSNLSPDNDIPKNSDDQLVQMAL